MILKDKIINKYFQVKQYIFYFLKHNSIFKIKPPKNYQLIFNDDFIFFDETKWLRGQPWGEYHPQYLHQYYDLDGDCSYVKNYNLFLKLKHEPKIINNVKINYKIGLITSKQKFKYGWFSADIQLPIGYNLWPAFWLCGADTWPPEIDIFEGYCDVDTAYDDFFLFKKYKWLKIQPNIHYKKFNKNKMYRSYNCPIYNSTNKFIQYVCYWEKDFIKIYYDGILVFKLTDKKILNEFNQKQFIILNTGWKYKENSIPSESIMKINNIQVYQKNG